MAKAVHIVKSSYHYRKTYSLEYIVYSVCTTIPEKFRHVVYVQFPVLVKKKIECVYGIANTAVEKYSVENIVID